MKRYKIIFTVGVLLVAVGFGLILGSAGNSDLGGDFTAVVIRAGIGLALMLAGYLIAKYGDKKMEG